MYVYVHIHYHILGYILHEIHPETGDSLSLSIQKLVSLDIFHIPTSPYFQCLEHAQIDASRWFHALTGTAIHDRNTTRNPTDS